MYIQGPTQVYLLFLYPLYKNPTKTTYLPGRSTTYYLDVRHSKSPFQ